MKIGLSLAFPNRILILEERAVEGRSAARDERTSGIRVEVRALVLDGVGALQLLEGTLELADVIEHLCGGKMQVRLAIFGIARLRCERFHVLDLISISVAEAPRPGEILVGDVEPRLRQSMRVENSIRLRRTVPAPAGKRPGR